MADWLHELHRERSNLKREGRFREMIPLQLAIIAESKATAHSADLANGWNYLSTLYLRAREYRKGEIAARKALAIYAAELNPKAEVLATYQFVLARLLAAQQRFAEAVLIAESAICNYRVFHDPPDEFLKDCEEELRLMQACCVRDLQR